MVLFNDKDLLSAHFKNGMMMLPYFYYNIATKVNSTASSSSNETRVRVSRIERLVNLLKGLRNVSVKKKKILIFSHTLFEVKIGERYYNSLHGSFYDIYKDDTLLIEDCDKDYIWRSNNSYKNLSFINTYLLILAGFTSKLLQKIHPIKHADYIKFVSRYPDLFTYESLGKADYFIRIYSGLIRTLFRLVQPRVVMINCALYGGDMAIVCYVAKKMGIKVLEPQHGSTYHNMAYEVSDMIVNSQEYQEYIPHFFLAFGDYWLKYVRWNCEKIVVGFHFLNNYVLTGSNKKNTYDFLVISQPLDVFYPETHKNEFVKELAGMYPNSRILFRIHPSEEMESQKAIFADCSNVEVVTSSTALYEDIGRCRNIIGWFSTCLFEVLAFNKIPIIVDTEPSRLYFPHDIGVWIKSPCELREINMENLCYKEDFSRYWAKNFKDNVYKLINIFNS